MSLPLLTSPENVRRIVRFLARKPAGATVDDTGATLGIEYVDPRKLATYSRLGVLTRENDRLKLTPDVGWEFARADETDFADRLRERLGSITAYFACLEWAYEQQLTELTSGEVGAYWHDHYPDELGTNNERQITQRATCFLRLCEGGGLGTYIIGRKGQPTRLDIDRDALEAFVHSREFSDPEVACKESTSGETNGEAADTGVITDAEATSANGTTRLAASTLGQAIFVGHGKNKTPLKQLRGILDQFKIPYHVAEDEPNLGRPISQKVAQIMKACNCAILLFTADEEFTSADGKTIWRPSENVVHEFGAAGFLYGNRVVVLKEDCVELPTNFRDIGYISFTRDELDAKAMDVLKELIGFGIVKVTT